MLLLFGLTKPSLRGRLRSGAAQVIAGLLAVSAVEAGSVVGKVDLPTGAGGRRIAVEKYTGKISGKVAPSPPPQVGVWLSRPGLSAPATPARVSLGQKDYQFGASLLVIPVGTTVAFPNDDPDYHNVFSLSRTKRFDLGRYKKSDNPAPTETFDRAGLVSLRCEIHEHMRANVLVVDSPYYAVTDAAGNFRIEGVPAGKYTLHAQLDKSTRWMSICTVGKTGTVTVSPVRTK